MRDCSKPSESKVDHSVPLCTKKCNPSSGFLSLPCFSITGSAFSNARATINDHHMQLRIEKLNEIVQFFGSSLDSIVFHWDPKDRDWVPKPPLGRPTSWAEIVCQHYEGIRGLPSTSQLEARWGAKWRFDNVPKAEWSRRRRLFELEDEVRKVRNFTLARTIECLEGRYPSSLAPRSLTERLDEEEIAAAVADAARWSRV